MKTLPVTTFSKVLMICKKNKSMKYFYIIRRHQYCFTGNIKEDVKLANKSIAEPLNNNTGHDLSSAFKFAFNIFYGMNFNPKFITARAGEISKFTTRLDLQQINLIKEKLQIWIKCCKTNAKNRVIHSRTSTYYAIRALLSSGMRIGELCSIKWYSDTASRIIVSNIDNKEYAEIIINTEKTGKKREIYIENEVYEWFVHNVNIKLKMPNITESICIFKKWAKFDFHWSAHSLRRTKATLMHEVNVDVASIAQVLGNTVKTCMNHYIISSGRNFDACDVANALMNGSISKYENVFLNKSYLKKNQ